MAPGTSVKWAYVPRWHLDERGAQIVADGGVSRDDLKECWCCDGLHDSPGTLCPDCDNAGCNRFEDGCESDHKPALADGGQPDGGLEREADAITSAFNEAAADYSPDLTWHGMGVNHDSGQRQFVMDAERYVDPDGLEAVREAGWKIQYIEAHNHEFDDDVVISINFPVREVTRRAE